MWGLGLVALHWTGRAVRLAIQWVIHLQAPHGGEALTIEGCRVLESLAGENLDLGQVPGATGILGLVLADLQRDRDVRNHPDTKEHLVLGFAATWESRKSTRDGGGECRPLHYGHNGHQSYWGKWGDAYGH